MTEEHKASRTIVKSPPELWAECSVAESLARHLGEFGEIRITRLEPETTVAWEGEHASGTVRLEPSGWGTHVTLTATPVVIPEPVHEVLEPEAIEPEPAAPEVVETEEVEEHEEVEAVAEVEGHGEDVAEHLPRWQVFARLWSRLGRKSHHSGHESGADEAEPPEAIDEAPEPIEVVHEPDLAAEMPGSDPVDEAPAPVPGLDPQGLLVGALDSLGQAHHRPFSRA
jgi:hypothetical protein